MIKHYHIHRGVQRSHNVRHFFIGFSLAIAIAVLGPLVIFRTPGTDASKNTGSSTKQSAVVGSDLSVQATLTTPLPWPKYGQAAYAVPEKDLFATSKQEEKAVPIASLAKVITALAILDHKPLTGGGEGPSLTLDEDDVELFNIYLSKDGVVVPVENGEKISQHQAMEAMLLMSANNMTDSLVRWAFGSVEEYVAYANAMLREKGISNTTVADASGFSPDTVSTPEDMTKIGYLYMQNDILRELIFKEKATIPVAGEIQNYNSFANRDDIFGIKIGNTDEAKRTYMAARIHGPKDNPDDISIAVVLGADNLQTAAKDAAAVLKAGDNAQ